MRTVQVSWHPEICCEICNDVIHNHFDCPVCNNYCAGTSCYGEIESDEEFSCEECNAKFRFIDWRGGDALVEIL